MVLRVGGRVVERRLHETARGFAKGRQFVCAVCIYRRQLQHLRRSCPKILQICEAWSRPSIGSFFSFFHLKWISEILGLTSRPAQNGEKSSGTRLHVKTDRKEIKPLANHVNGVDLPAGPTAACIFNSPQFSNFRERLAVSKLAQGIFSDLVQIRQGFIDAKITDDKTVPGRNMEVVEVWTSMTVPTLQPGHRVRCR
jgi:hypothetical protein